MDADTDSDADADADGDGDSDADAHQDCLDGCDFASECGALPNQVRECRGACDRGEVPNALASCLAAAAANRDCPSWGLCFEPVDGDFCEPWCDFAAACSFATVEDCLQQCTNDPPPVSVGDCLDQARQADDCRQAVSCITDPLPEEFCQDLCARADDCGFLDETVDECVAGCGPVAPQPLVECVNDALNGGRCRDLARCFRDGGPGEQGCQSVCGLRGDCHGWNDDQNVACQADCRDRPDPGFGACVQRAIDSGSCDDADACFGELNLPPDGYCAAACDFETVQCQLILPEETARCVEVCAVGGQSDEFYACRQGAIDAADCDAYLGCAP